MTVHDKDYALLVGINDYPWYTSLQGPIADAADLERWLVDATRGGGLPTGNIRTITSTADSPAGPLPQQLQIDLTLDKLFEQVAAAGGGRRFYFYFGGHGFANKISDVALCLATWSKRMRSQAISSLSYRDAIADHGLFKEIVVFLDCCRTREVAAVGFSPSNPRPIPASTAGQTRFFIAHATENMQAALEAAVPGTSPDDTPMVRGHFTRALLAALWGGAATNNGGVLAADLKRYIERETPLIAVEAKQSQKPEVLDGLDGATIFGVAQPKLEVEIVIRPERAGEVVLEGPQLQEIKRGPAASSPWIVDLTGGMHVLREVGTQATQIIPFRPAQTRQRVEF